MKSISLILLFGGVAGILWLVAVAADNNAAENSRVSRCQKQADTPYEYHQCR